jgi:hypothetical protein
MNVPALNPDLLIAVVLVATTLYGFIGGSARIKALVLSTYMGIVLADTLTNIVSPYVKFLAISQVSLILMLLPILLFAIPKHTGKGHKGNSLVNMLAGLAAGAFVATASLHVIPPSLVTQTASNSIFVTELQGLYIWFVAAMPLVAILPNMISKIGKRNHH